MKPARKIRSKTRRRKSPGEGKGQAPKAPPLCEQSPLPVILLAAAAQGAPKTPPPLPICKLVK